jgi:hypothetical protein
MIGSLQHKKILLDENVCHRNKMFLLIVVVIAIIVIKWYLDNQESSTPVVQPTNVVVDFEGQTLLSGFGQFIQVLSLGPPPILGTVTTNSLPGRTWKIELKNFQLDIGATIENILFEVPYFPSGPIDYSNYNPSATFSVGTCSNVIGSINEIDFTGCSGIVGDTLVTITFSSNPGVTPLSQFSGGTARYRLAGPTL